MSILCKWVGDVACREKCAAGAYEGPGSIARGRKGVSGRGKGSRPMFTVATGLDDLAVADAAKVDIVWRKLYQPDRVDS